MSLFVKMSVVVTYSVKDLFVITEKMMNTFYKSEWKEEITDEEEFLFNKIKSMHLKILKDLEVEDYTTGASTLFDVINRLEAIENAISGTSEHVDDSITVRKCIERTEKIIGIISGESRRRICTIA